MKFVPVEEVQARLPELLAGMIAGEEVTVTDNGRPVARLTRLFVPKGDRPLGTAKGKIVIADDFDAPLEDFKDYT
jgi:antitoxin (DNA-binding transcriptional repressor) of toxin-antitoxin stability system